MLHRPGPTGSCNSERQRLTTATGTGYRSCLTAARVVSLLTDGPE